MRKREHEHEWVLKEYGYVRSWGTTVHTDPLEIIAVYGGTEDFSEYGDGQMILECDCGAAWVVPQHIEIIYR